MMTALYVFIGVLAAALVIYIFDEIVTFIRKVKRKLKEKDETESEVKRIPYNGYYGANRQTYYSGLDTWRLREIQCKLDRLEDKIDTLIDDAAELMIAKERPEE